MAKVAYTLREAAQSASIHVSNIEVAVREGTLQAKHISGEVVITHQDLRAWVAAQSDFSATRV